MKYRIELAATAKADIHGQARWLRDEASPAAEKWLAGLYKAIDTLQTRPLPFPFGAASTWSSPTPIASGLSSSVRRYGTSPKGNSSSGGTSARMRFFIANA
jgi:hypothetical protein